MAASHIYRLARTAAAVAHAESPATEHRHRRRHSSLSVRALRVCVSRNRVFERVCVRARAPSTANECSRRPRPSLRGPCSVLTTVYAQSARVSSPLSIVVVVGRACSSQTVFDSTVARVATRASPLKCFRRTHAQPVSNVRRLPPSTVVVVVHGRRPPLAKASALDLFPENDQTHAPAVQLIINCSSVAAIHALLGTRRACAIELWRFSAFSNWWIRLKLILFFPLLVRTTTVSNTPCRGLCSRVHSSVIHQAVIVKLVVNVIFYYY